MSESLALRRSEDLKLLRSEEGLSFGGLGEGPRRSPAPALDYARP